MNAPALIIGDLAADAMLLGVRRARRAIAGSERLEWAATLELDGADPARVADCLRDLGCLPDWWPGARAITPLPPGLSQVGDSALLETRAGAVMVRVLAYRPARRVVLALAETDATLCLVDLGLDAREGAVRVRLGLETPRRGGLLADARAARRLRLVGDQAIAALALHLEAPRRGHAPRALPTRSRC